jgi:hypothetical protein
MKTGLTAAQKEIYNSVKTAHWFACDDIDIKFSSRFSHCKKIAEKGFFNSKPVFRYADGKIVGHGWKFKKIIKAIHKNT